MTLVILSNKEQYEAFLAYKSTHPADHIEILCDNPSFYGFLENKKVLFNALNEEHIQDRWESIDVWACEKALLWGSLITRHDLFDGIEFDKVLYVYFSNYLSNILKNHLLADYAYKKYKPGITIVFNEESDVPFPSCDGNYFLNIFLHAIAQRRGLNIITIDIRHNRSGNRPQFKDYLKKRIQRIYGKFSSAKEKEDTFIITGSLKHIDLVIREIRVRNKNIIMYDHDLNIRNLIFCLKNNIHYIVPESLTEKSDSLKVIRTRYHNDFMDIADIMREKKWFTYEKNDLSAFLFNEFSFHADAFVGKIASLADICENISQRYILNGIILNEDWSPRNAFMAAYFKRKNIKAFCISHGYGPIRFKLPEESRIFFLSETFVNSEFEKEYFSSRGWDRDHLHVTGIPRYDRLIALKNQKKEANRKIGILFSAGQLVGYSPRNPFNNYYMGTGRFTLGDNMRTCLEDTIEAIDKFDIELIVIPRANYDEDVWKYFINKHKKRNNIMFLSSQKDFFKVLSQCDAMFIGYWSTSIIESVICGKPTVIISHTGLEDPYPFVKEGLCKIAHTLEDLKRITAELYKYFKEEKQSCYILPEPRKNIFYTGINDGNNTKRVVDRILDMSHAHAG